MPKLAKKVLFLLIIYPMGNFIASSILDCVGKQIYILPQ
jgi:hypothetical protein